MYKTLVALTLLLATSYAWVTADVTLSSTSPIIASSNGIQVYGTTNDKIGNTVANAGDFNNDGYEDYLIGTANARAYLVLGASSARTATLDLVATATQKSTVLLFTFTGATGNVVVSAAGDMNKDGFDDIAFGMPAYDPTSAANTGIVFVYYGKSTADITAGAATLALDTTTATTASSAYFRVSLNTGVANTFLGFSLAAAGNIDGDADAVDDLLVGAPGAPAPSGAGAAANDGAVYVISGKKKSGTPLANTRVADVQPDQGSFSTQGFAITGKAGGALRVGAFVAGVGDVNGDDVNDILIGAPASPAATKTGKVFLYYGKSTGFAGDALADAQTGSPPKYSVITGAANDVLFGWDVGYAGDLNGDGEGDYFIGAPLEGSNAGKVYVIWGKTGSTVRADLTVADNMVIADGIVITGPASSYLGTNSDGGIDVNRDQVDDIVMCAPGMDYTAANPTVAGTGKCYVLYGKTSIATLTLPPTSGAGLTITGLASTGFGKSVSAVGDVNNDSGDDFIISAPSGASSGASPINTAGTVYEFHGVGVTPSGSGFRLGASLLVFVSFFAALLF